MVGTAMGGDIDPSVGHLQVINGTVRAVIAQQVAEAPVIHQGSRAFGA